MHASSVQRERRCPISKTVSKTQTTVLFARPGLKALWRCQAAPPRNQAPPRHRAFPSALYWQAFVCVRVNSDDPRLWHYPAVGFSPNLWISNSTRSAQYGIQASKVA